MATDTLWKGQPLSLGQNGELGVKLGTCSSGTISPVLYKSVFKALVSWDGRAWFSSALSGHLSKWTFSGSFFPASAEGDSRSTSAIGGRSK